MTSDAYSENWTSQHKRGKTVVEYYGATASSRAILVFWGQTLEWNRIIINSNSSRTRVDTLTRVIAPMISSPRLIQWLHVECDSCRSRVDSCAIIQRK